MQSASSQRPEVAQVLFELDSDGRWTPHCLELLSDARALAARLNGSVGGWVLTAAVERPLDRATLAAHGCQHLRHLTHDRFAQWSSEAIAATLSRHLPPESRLIFLPGNPRGEEVAAVLAETLQTAWIPDAITLSATRTGTVEISAVLPGGKLSRTFRPSGASAVVVTIRAGVAEIRSEKPQELHLDEARADLDQVPELTSVTQFIAANPQTIDLTFANRIVSAGRGAGGPEGVALVGSLAEALRASLGGSRMAVDLGWLPQMRQVGQTGRTVNPELYVACGISGASHHLLGMRTSKHIVVINPDSKAPINEIAHLSLPADLHDLIPRIIAAVQKRSQASSTDSP